MKNIALIMAAGSGTRMKAKINKQFLLMDKKPVLYYTIKAFEDNQLIDDIVLVISKMDISYCEENIVEKYNFKKIRKIISGGETRQESVLNGLKSLDNCNVVLIHDGARPFVSNRIISQGIKFAEIHGAAACGVKPKDTIKIINNFNMSEATLEREKLFSVQTPQCFNYELIFKCHKKAFNETFKATDDTMIVERYFNNVYLYEGSYDNIKITTPEDLVIGEKLVQDF
jgi:2-C-methyl-D-erythritol 4-phosphate cytidylyltransferase